MMMIDITEWSRRIWSDLMGRISNWLRKIIGAVGATYEGGSSFSPSAEVIDDGKDVNIRLEHCPDSTSRTTSR
jgi:hypothetical protein